MATSEARTGNLGEWSELYTLGYLLVHGGAFAADENQKPIPEIFHKVLQVYLAEKLGQPETEYVINKDDVAILIDGKIAATVYRSAIEGSLEVMLQELTDGSHKKTFPLVTGNSLLDLLKRSRISASSSEHENDLELILEDLVTKSPTPRVGFNIKSQIGGRSTLLNASGATNFVYKVISNDPSIQNQLPSFVHGKHGDNLKLLYGAGFHLEFESMSNEVFYQNLTLLDMQFPNHLKR
jgi:hypothetical protein